VLKRRKTLPAATPLISSAPEAPEPTAVASADVLMAPPEFAVVTPLRSVGVVDRTVTATTTAARSPETGAVAWEATAAADAKGEAAITEAIARDRGREDHIHSPPLSCPIVRTPMSVMNGSVSKAETSSGTTGAIPKRSRKKSLPDTAFLQRTDSCLTPYERLPAESTGPGFSDQLSSPKALAKAGEESQEQLLMTYYPPRLPEQLIFSDQLVGDSPPTFPPETGGCALYYAETTGGLGHPVASLGGHYHAEASPGMSHGGYHEGGHAIGPYHHLHQEVRSGLDGLSRRQDPHSVGPEDRHLHYPELPPHLFTSPVPYELIRTDPDQAGVTELGMYRFLCFLK
jgi:hypothetical protein